METVNNNECLVGSYIQSGTAEGLPYMAFYPTMDVGPVIFNPYSTFGPNIELTSYKELSYDELLMIEKAAYEKNKDKWLKDYEGKFVAFLNGKYLDSDLNYSSLAARVLVAYPSAPIYIPRVVREDRKLRVSSPKLKRKK